MPALLVVAGQAALQLHLLLFEVIEPGTLHLRLLRRLVGTLVEAVPVGLPGQHRRLGILQRLCRTVGFSPGRIEHRLIALELAGEFRQAIAILFAQRHRLGQRLAGLNQV